MASAMGHPLWMFLPKPPNSLWGRTESFACLTFWGIRGRSLKQAFPLTFRKSHSPNLCFSSYPSLRLSLGSFPSMMRKLTTSLFALHFSTTLSGSFHLCSWLQNVAFQFHISPDLSPRLRPDPHQMLPLEWMILRYSALNVFQAGSSSATPLLAPNIH